VTDDVQKNEPEISHSVLVSPECVPRCAQQAVRAPPESSGTSSADVYIPLPRSSTHSAYNVHMSKYSK